MKLLDKVHTRSDLAKPRQESRLASVAAAGQHVSFVARYVISALQRLPGAQDHPIAQAAFPRSHGQRRWARPAGNCANVRLLPYNYVSGQELVPINIRSLGSCDPC